MEFYWTVGMVVLGNAFAIGLITYVFVKLGLLPGVQWYWPLGTWAKGKKKLRS